jgi:hypothetical protein
MLQIQALREIGCTKRSKADKRCHYARLIPAANSWRTLSLGPRASQHSASKFGDARETEKRKLPIESSASATKLLNSNSKIHSCANW